jgi:plasmid maintenance system antidote protein VapI
MQMPLKPTRHAPQQPTAEITEGCMRLRALGLTCAILAQKTGVSPQSAGAWLLGRSRPTFEKTVELQKIFGIDPRSFNHVAGWHG